MALQAGHLFGNYHIVRQIGEGGFGEVYLAENPLISRLAAVKVLHAALARDAELVRRFLNEARAASAIRHRNIIEVFDAGVTPEGAPYIPMEFLEGVSLHKRLADQDRLALPQVLQIAAQAGSALAAAHTAGIVHRDLKPENLFLVPDPGAPGGELVKILDFGIAKTVGSRAAGGAIRTQAGLIMGSPTYMSPEQCRDSADVDLRSDIYSFAIIVYKMLSGRTPYVAASGTEMLLMHLAATPPPLRQWMADLPAHVEAAVMRGLARARTDRFDTMASFIAALRGAGQGGTSALDQPSSSGEPTAVMEDSPEATRTATRVLPVNGVSGGRAAAPPAAARHLPAAGKSPLPAEQWTDVGQGGTTFSRVTGQIAEAGSDDRPRRLGTTQPGRWLAFALGAMAVAGGAYLLLGQPRQDARPRTKSGAPDATAALAASPVLPARQELSRDAGLLAPVILPSKSDSETAPPVVTGARPGTKPPHLTVGATAASHRHGHGQAPRSTRQRASAAPGARSTFPSTVETQDDVVGF
jgi:hypothetical protein